MEQQTDIARHYYIIYCVLSEMASIHAPKQWALSKQENITSFEAWRQNLQYTLSLGPNFASFLVDGFVWQKTNVTPLCGLVNDDADIPETTGHTCVQKVSHLELMFAQLANFCLVIS